MGNEYEATYPKRAKGLVKNGRARFIDEHTLCLACPPNDYLEDKSMNNNYEQPAGAVENRDNGPRPPAQSHAQPAPSKEWLKNLDIAAIAEHMESADILELMRALPEEVMGRVDITAITEHMESEDIVELVQSLPAEQLKRLDIASIVEHLEDSGSILKFMKRILN